MSPYEVMFGRKPRFATELGDANIEVLPCPSPETVGKYVEDIRTTAESMHEVVSLLACIFIKMKDYTLDLW